MEEQHQEGIGDESEATPGGLPPIPLAGFSEGNQYTPDGQIRGVQAFIDGLRRRRERKRRERGANR